MYTHNPLEAEACENAGIEMIELSSEVNNIEGIRKAAQEYLLYSWAALRKIYK